MAISKRFLCFRVLVGSVLLPSYSRHAPVKLAPGASATATRVISGGTPYRGMSAH
jgi:tetrahydromethanopterin S-methyltransferase subunit D